MSNLLFFTPFAVYLAVVVLVTIRVRSRSEDSEYFFASKGLNAIPALLSVVASETSVATTVVFPAVGMKSGYVLLWLLLGYIAGRTLVAVFYLRTLYESSRLTIYQTMSANHRVLEGAYLLAKYISGGARYFIGGYALHQILGGPTALWIFVVACCVAAYSLTGGLRAIVVMDQVQSLLILACGVFLCVWLFRSVPEGALPAPVFFDWNPGNYTFAPVLFVGGVVLTIGSHGADQALLLRVLSTKSFRHAQQSLVVSGFVAALLITLYLTIGYLLQAVSKGGLDPRSPLVDFVTSSNLPLLSGVFLVLLTAAAMSSLDSTVHSTGAIWKSLMNSRRSGRVWSVLSLFIMIAFALLFSVVERRHPDFLSLCMGSMNYVNGGLIGVFTVFTFLPRRMTGLGVVLGLIAGFALTTVCEWAFAAPVPWTYTVLLASSGSFVACVIPGLCVSQRPPDAQATR